MGHIRDRFGVGFRPPDTESVTDQGVAGRLVLRNTGLPARSARRAPPAPPGRCIEEPGPVPMLPNDVLRSARGGCQAPLKECRTTWNPFVAPLLKPCSWAVSLP
jgi:hypothetical protein